MHSAWVCCHPGVVWRSSRHECGRSLNFNLTLQDSENRAIELRLWYSIHAKIHRFVIGVSSSQGPLHWPGQSQPTLLQNGRSFVSFPYKKRGWEKFVIIKVSPRLEPAKIKVRLPRIEPGAPAWKANVLTTKQVPPAVTNRAHRDLPCQLWPTVTVRRPHRLHAWLR